MFPSTIFKRWCFKIQAFRSGFHWFLPFSQSVFYDCFSISIFSWSAWWTWADSKSIWMRKKKISLSIKQNKTKQTPNELWTIHRGTEKWIIIDELNIRKIILQKITNVFYPRQLWSLVRLARFFFFISLRLYTVHYYYLFIKCN